MRGSAHRHINICPGLPTSGPIFFFFFTTAIAPLSKFKTRNKSVWFSHFSDIYFLIVETKASSKIFRRLPFFLSTGIYRFKAILWKIYISWTPVFNVWYFHHMFSFISKCFLFVCSHQQQFWAFDGLLKLEVIIVIAHIKYVGHIFLFIPLDDYESKNENNSVLYFPICPAL